MQPPRPLHHYFQHPAFVAIGFKVHRTYGLKAENAMTACKSELMNKPCCKQQAFLGTFA